MSLIEVLVALAILLVMSAVVFESLSNSIQFHNILAARDETVRTARAAVSKLTRDLQLAYLTPNKEAVNTYMTVFVGYDDEPSKLYFSTLNHQRLYLNSRECDQAEITVWAEPAPEERGRGFILYHRESPRIDQYPDEQGVIWPLAYNVRSFRLRYLDQQSNEWKTSWDTRSADTPYRLPRAVEIGLVLIAPDLGDDKGENTVDVPFLSRVVLEYAPRLPNPNDPALLAAGGTNGTNGTNGLTGTWNPFASGTYANGGGLGGLGAAGLSGGQLGGTLGMLPGANKGSSGRSPGRSPGRPPAGGPR
jgi:general secretion pathway protein J